MLNDRTCHIGLAAPRKDRNEVEGMHSLLDYTLLQPSNKKIIEVKRILLIPFANCITQTNQVTYS